MHGDGEPSPWLLRWVHLLPAQAKVLDVACGRGRHVRWLAERGHQVTALDRDALALEGLQGQAETVQADIESGPWPLAGRRFDMVLVTHYLHRPLWPNLLAALDDGGLLVYETFAQGNETVGRPSNPNFLLQPGELLRACAGLRVLGYEDGFCEPPPRFVQRIVALRESPDAAPAARHRLPG